nr:hypothetical protein [Tanacetum cinerariifolium]
ECFNNSSNEVNAAGSSVFTVGLNFTNSTNDFSAAGPLNAAMPNLEDSSHNADDVGAEADINNMESIISVSPIPTSRIHKDHLTSQIISDMSSTTKTRSMARGVRDQGGISQMFNEDFHTCMFACFLSQEEPKRVHQALKDPSWIEAMQEELLQFKMQKVWILVDLPYRKRAIGHTQEEGIDYEEVFAPIARIKAIRLFLAYASFMRFPVYQIDVKSIFLYGTIEEEVYICQPPGFEDPQHPDKVYKVVKALYGLHQAPKDWVLVTKPHNKTPYELLHGRLPSIGFMRPFGCLVTILNTLDPLGKFQGKVDEGFLVGYSVCSKAFRVFNSRTRFIQETLHVNFMENNLNVAGSGLAWLFDIDSLSQTMNYHPVLAENQTNSHAGFQDTEKAGEEGTQTYVLFLVLSDGSTNPKNNKDAHTDGKEHDDIQKSMSPDIYSSSYGDLTREQGDKTENRDKGKSPVVTITGFRDLNEEFAKCINNSSNGFNAAGSSVFAAGLNFTNSTNDFSAVGPLNAVMPNLEDLSLNADDVGAEADINNMESIILVSPIPTSRIHKDHPTSQIIALKDPSWIEAMQEELLQFKMHKVWILVDLPYGKRAIGTKWVYRNKKDERGIVIINKARLVAQGHTQEEGIDYEEVFAPVARIEAIRLF